MKSQPAAPEAPFWTWRKKLFLLLLVLFVTLSDYYLANAGPSLAFEAKEYHYYGLFPFSYARLFYGTWQDVYFAEYWLVMSPFLLGYLIWWFKPNVLRAIFPCLYMLTFGVVYFQMLRSSYMAIPWSHAVGEYPEYAAQIPAWLKFLYM